MSNPRLEQLMRFLEEDPNDPFTLYAIATEHLKTAPHQAQHYFEILLRDHPDYVATYYHAAHLYIDLEMYDQAETTFKTGIKVAADQGDQLALRELRSAYDQYLFEQEDD